MAAYEVILQTQAWNALAGTAGVQRRRLLAVLDQLAAEPFRTGDFRQRDETGRSNEVALLEGWLVTFWIDHAVREIRVIGLERPVDGS